ncbi:hypothetical protein RvY_06463 [Ramazzottius varieornatus]|uniref:Uncharacterized protein n=1 Tax=Ramazzottius varieornatus TaxID=947166 RepID=A0A1D1V1M1_RAMVA|nr:hypothetical protein RvY_06463 [Ramazzottius varieornatus]
MPTSVVIPTEKSPSHEAPVTKKREPPTDGTDPHPNLKKKLPLPFTHRHWTLPRIGADVDWEKQYDGLRAEIRKFVGWFAKIASSSRIDDDERPSKKRGKYTEEFDKKVEFKEEDIRSYFTALNEIYETMPETDKDRFCFLLQRAGVTNMKRLSQDCRKHFEKEFIGGEHLVTMVSIAEPWLRLREEKEFRQAYKALPNFQKQLVGNP